MNEYLRDVGLAPIIDDRRDPDYEEYAQQQTSFKTEARRMNEIVENYWDREQRGFTHDEVYPDISVPPIEMYHRMRYWEPPAFITRTAIDNIIRRDAQERAFEAIVPAMITRNAVRNVILRNGETPREDERWRPRRGDTNMWR